jgi:hypothetical protein
MMLASSSVLRCVGTTDRMAQNFIITYHIKTMLPKIRTPPIPEQFLVHNL